MGIVSDRDWKQIEGWFENHKVEMKGETEFIWANPGSSFYWCRIIARPNVCIMYGDMGPIVLGIYDKDPERILACVRDAGLQYLCSKLQKPWETKYDREETEEWLRAKMLDEEYDEKERARVKTAVEAMDDYGDWDNGHEVYKALEDAGCQDVFEGYLVYTWNHVSPIVYGLKLAAKAWFAERERLAAIAQATGASVPSPCPSSSP